MRNVSANTRKLTTLAMLAALAIVLVALIHFPLVPAAPFLEYDPADIPIFIGTFLFGPAAGLALTAVVCVIQGVTVSAASGPIGIIMHFLATGTFVLLAGNLYRAHRTRKAALLGLAAGTLAMTAVMCVCNLVFTPLFMGSPVGEVVKLLLPAIIPFNLAKAAINSVITYLVYKPISRLVFGEDVYKRQEQDAVLLILNEFQEQIQHFAAHYGVQPAGGLVQHQQFGMVRQRRGERQLGAHAL